MKTSNERTQSIKNKVRTKRDRRLAIWTSSVAACVLVVLTVVCSLPILGEDVPPINAYKPDEYYPLIQKINEQYQDNKYSIFESMGSMGSLKDEASSRPPTISEPMDADVAESNGASSSVENKYEETTLNQVDGVVEGDILKRSTTHAFYLKKGNTVNTDKQCLVLDAYRLAGNDTEKVAEYRILMKDDTTLSYSSSGSEMFLSSDATRATIITACANQGVNYTVVISLDITNPAAITEVNRVYMSGTYESARLVDGKFLVITNFNTWRGTIDYDKKETYVPQCGNTLNEDYIPMKDIYLPNNCLNVGYTVLAMLDETSLEVEDTYAVYSYTDDVYVSHEYIVLGRNNRYYYRKQFDYGNEINETKANALTSSRLIMTCEIVALKYGDKFEKLGETGIEGCIKDRYSMDEKDGVLRVFTTTRHKPNPFIWEEQSSLNVSLYCVDLATMKVIASKESFAPAGDEVKSVRFDGDKAYVCTARGTIDPVFYFDLSDLNNITYVDTGEIAGFSVNLIKFNDLLLGIGYSEVRDLKVELYKESDDVNAENGVISVAAYEKQCNFSYEYKAHFVNAEHNLVGLEVVDWSSDVVSDKPQNTASRRKYLLLRYDETTQQFDEIYFDTFDCYVDLARAFYDHNGVYVFGENDFAFIDLSETV